MDDEAQPIPPKEEKAEGNETHRAGQAHGTRREYGDFFFPRTKQRHIQQLVQQVVAGTAAVTQTSGTAIANSSQHAWSIFDALTQHAMATTISVTQQSVTTLVDSSRETWEYLEGMSQSVHDSLSTLAPQLPHLFTEHIALPLAKTVLQDDRVMRASL